MNDCTHDSRTVMTLDAGGTNLVFSAIRGCRQVIDPIRLPSSPNDLTACLQTLIDGFERVRSLLTDAPVAISFAFPGPADYPKGIIGDLPNLPAFRGGVALGPMLSEHFSMPVYINNDGNLYAYGEAIAGFLPEVNRALEAAGSPKRYRNLVGFTLGTGFGCGLVFDGRLLIGDNSNAGEAWLLSNQLNINENIEQAVSIRALRRFYAKGAAIPEAEAPEPAVLFQIAQGKAKGDAKAATAAFVQMGEALGEAIRGVLTLTDGLVVIGGGVAGANRLFLQAACDAMNASFHNAEGSSFRKLIPTVFNWEEAEQRSRFLKGETRSVLIPHSGGSVLYDPMPRSAVGVSKIGTDYAIAIGAYAFALNDLDSQSRV